MRIILAELGPQTRRYLALLAATCLALLGGCSGFSPGPNPQGSTPSTPANLTATALGPAQVSLSWTASTGTIPIASYQVERCQGMGCSNFAGVATPASTTFSDSGLAGSTSYSYRVRATDNAGNVSAYSAVATVVTPAPTFTAPMNLLATATSSTQISLTWSAATETGGTISKYLVERCQGAGCSSFTQVATPATTSFGDTGLTPATSYSYRVRATDASNNLSAYSNVSGATTSAASAPTAPTNLTATTAGPQQINLSWTASTEAGGTISQYLVERCQGAGCSNFVQAGTSATVTYNDASLTASTSYSYRVRAQDASNNLGPYSATATATTSAPTFTAPTNLTATASGPAQVNLVWSAATETGGTISGYLVERCQGAGCSNFAQVGTSATTSYNDTGLTGSTSYSYRVRATDAANDLGPYSATASATTAAPVLTAPSNLTATAVSAVQVNLVWTAATETGGTITQYLVERCQGAGCSNFVQVGASPTTSYSDTTGLTALTSYSYRVRATDSANDLGPYSATATATTSSVTFTAPTNLTATASGAAQINLTWTAATETGGTLSGYLVERCQGSGCSNFAQIGTSSTTSYNDTGLTGSTSYSYRVRATDAANDLGPYSATATATTATPTFTAPANPTATASSPVQINLSWTAATETGGAITKYLVERCQGAGCSTFTQVGTSASTSYNDTGLSGSTSYSYRVRATDANNNLGPYSATATATTGAPTFTAPTSLTATASGPVQINLSWTAATETGGTITKYLVERCQGAGCSSFAQVGTSTTTSYNDTGLTGSTSYSYRVRATDAANNLGPYSAIATTTTAAPTFTAPTNLTATASGPVQINLSWTAATETGGTITQYLVERCQGSGCSSFAQIGTSPTTSYNDTGLTGSTSYSYRVRAADASNNKSAYSNTASATTAAPTFTAPSNLTATASSSSQINLNWTTATETGGTITEYLVERCQGSSCSSFAQAGTAPSTSYTDTALTASTSYSYRVRATDASNNMSGYSNTASATTQAAGSVTVTISPKRGSITTSQTQQFTATVSGTGNTAVTWEVDGTTGGSSATGTISATGLFTPGTQAGLHTITAVSAADTSATAAANFAVTNLAGVFTYHNDLTRDGANTQEYALTTATVNMSTFGKATTCTIDGAAYAQPLWVGNLAIGGGTHNVIFAATTHDSVYAFDADASPCVQYWKKSLLPAGDTWVGSPESGTQDIFPDIGIIGTPVIDPSTNTLYVVSKSEVSASGCSPLSSCHQQLHALSLIDGSEKLGGPLNITSAISVSGTGDGSSGGKVAFNTLTQNQRPGLVLLNGILYVAWASHGDNGPYHGWVVGFNTSPSLGISATFNANPNGSDSGIWMSGGAPAADSSGNLYLLTGNGTFDANTGGPDYGDSTLKLSTPGLTVLDSFTPGDQLSLAQNDNDHGSGGAAILVNSPQGNYVIGGGKEGNYFLLNQNSLGGYTASNTGAAQIFGVGNGIFSTAAFWNSSLYVVPVFGYLEAYPFNTGTGRFNTAGMTEETTSQFAFPGATPSISASSASQNGIVWAIDSSAYAGNGSTSGPSILHAFDASNVATELWNSSQVPADQAGNAVKFTVPTVANGKVYIGTMTEIDIYTLKPN